MLFCILLIPFTIMFKDSFITKSKERGAMSEIQTTYDDEIELIDIFRILWKWKILIFFGTLAFGIGSVFYSLQLPKVYKTEMTIQPGILKIDTGGQRVYFNSLKDIVGRIEAGLYNNEVILNVLNDKSKEPPEQLDFDNEIPPDSNVLKISYKTQDLQEGNAVLKYLFSLISKEEGELLTGVSDGYNNRINLNEFALDRSETLILSYKKNEKAISKRINEVYKDIEEMNVNSSYLRNERKKILEKTVGVEGSLSALLYSNTVQQSIQFVNIVKKDLNEYYRLKEKETQKIILEKEKQKKILQANNNLVKERDSIVGMKILIPPENSSHDPIKPKKKLIVLLSLVTGLFFWIFSAFIIEYLRNNSLTEKA